MPPFLNLSTVFNTPTRVCLSVPRASWIVAVNTDARFRVGDNKINFFIYYEVDGDTSKHHLSASN